MVGAMIIRINPQTEKWINEINRTRIIKTKTTGAYIR